MSPAIAAAILAAVQLIPQLIALAQAQGLTPEEEAAKLRELSANLDATVLRVQALLIKDV